MIEVSSRSRVDAHPALSAGIVGPARVARHAGWPVVLAYGLSPLWGLLAAACGVVVARR